MLFWVVLILKDAMMKRFLICILLLALLLPTGAFAAADCSAEAMILYEPRTGTVLREKNADVISGARHLRKDALLRHLRFLLHCLRFLLRDLLRDLRFQR